MLTESNLNLFRNNILTETLHIPHGITNAKVVCHVDLDGVCSGISMVQQLIKQGIKKDRITVEFAQYGDDKKQGRDFVKTFQNKNKQQWVGVTDFAKYPRYKIWEKFNQLMSFKGNKQSLVSFVNSRDFSKVANEEDFANIFKKTFNPKETKFTRKSIDEMYDACKAYCLYSKKENPITLKNVEKYEVQLVKPDFGSDHHSNEDGKLSAAKRGDLAVSSPSEAEFFANKYAPGLWSEADLKAISMVDSAGYTKKELENSVFLEKHFIGPDRKRNLAQLVGILYDSLCKKDEKVAKWIILNSGPNLISLYSHVKEGTKLNGERLRLVEAIKNGDMKTGQEIANALPKILNKNWTDVDGDNYKDRNGKAISKVVSLDQYREGNLKHLKADKTGYKSEADEAKLREIKGKRSKDAKQIRDEINAKEGTIFHFKNFSFSKNTDKRNQRGRYDAALLSKDGRRQPYIMRYWGDMFQISLNPIYSKACKEAGITEDLVNFAEVNKHVIEDVKKFLISKGISEFNANRFVEGMANENGGHKSAIWTFSQFDAIKPSSKELGGDRYYKDRDLMYRANEIDERRTGKKATTQKAKIEVMKKYLKDAPARLEAAEKGPIAKYKDLKEQCVKVAQNSAVNWTNKLYPPRPEGLKALVNYDKRFEINK